MNILLLNLFFWIFAFSNLACAIDKQNAPTIDVKFLDYSLYHTKLITRSLENHSTYKIHPNKEYFPSLRVLKAVQKGHKLNVFWGPGIKSLEDKNVTRINIPLVQGLSSYRIMLIRKSDKYRIRNYQNIKNLVFGQVHGWIDTDIYRLNALEFKTSPDLPSLFTMLLAGRFDAIPLGADMVETHLKSNKTYENHLAIEDSNIIYYPMPVYFYVSNKLPTLVRDLTLGLESLKKSGEMKKIFQAHFGTLVERLKLCERNIVSLDNPFLIDQASIPNKIECQP